LITGIITIYLTLRYVVISGFPDTYPSENLLVCMPRPVSDEATCLTSGLVKKLATLVAELKLGPPSCPQDPAIWKMFAP
jgi:hypothetical protein